MERSVRQMPRSVEDRRSVVVQDARLCGQDSSTGPVQLSYCCRLQVMHCCEKAIQDPGC